MIDNKSNSGWGDCEGGWEAGLKVHVGLWVSSWDEFLLANGSRQNVILVDGGWVNKLGSALRSKR